MSASGPAAARAMTASVSLWASLCLLSACASDPGMSEQTAPGRPHTEVSSRNVSRNVLPAVAPTDAFLAAIRAHCGKAYASTVQVDTPPPANSPFAGSALVMHVRECGADGIRIPFHVGEDRSRTWVLTRTASGLRLKHDHRHRDGSPDAVTQYGGDTVAAESLAGASAGTAIRQEFPVDAESVENFLANGLKASVKNTWAMEIERDRRFVYELSRPDGRLFRVEFDLSRPILPPPAPWGSDGAGD